MADASPRVAVIVTRGDPHILADMATTCTELARSGAHLTIFFRDESIPSICRPEIAQRILPEGWDVGIESQLYSRLKAAGQVGLYACTSSLYLWGVTSDQLLSVVDGGRGLIAFLAEDVAGAFQVLSY